MPEVDELVEDPLDHRHLGRIALDQRHPLVLDACALSRLQRLQRFARFVEQEPARSVGRRSARPVALFGDLHASAPYFVAQFAAVLRRAEPLELDIDRVKRIVLAGLADGRVNDLLVVLLALSAELGGEVDILESSPPRHVQAQDIAEVGPLFDPLLHHLGERGPPLRCQTGFAGVREFLDDLDAILIGPLANLVPLDWDGVLLPVLGRVPVVSHRPQFGRGHRKVRRFGFPPLCHVLSP